MSNKGDSSLQSSTSLGITDVRQDLRSAAEALMRQESTYTSESIAKLSLDEISVLVHELRVHQIELEMQNEELRRVQVELESVQGRYFDIYDVAPVGYLILSEEGLIVESNITAATMLGLTRSSLIRRGLSQYIRSEDQDIFYVHRKKLFESMNPKECELRMLREDGTEFWGHMKSTVKLEDGQTTCRIILSDVSRRKKAENEITRFAYSDYLTGLYNRRHFEDELKRLDIDANLPLSIIMFDVNGLKLINDSFGHEAGDGLLSRAATIIKRASPRDAVIARIGGDEFAVLLPKCRAEETAAIASHIKQLAAEATVAHIELSISYGYDTKEDIKESIMDVLANAENHMYRRKLYERKSIRSRIVDLIMNTLFENSPRESLHSTRVSNICQAIASKMSFDKGYVDKIRVSGLIHDIGKISIGEEILNRAGDLSSDEAKQIERHPEAGWRILSAINEFSELAQFVRDHHERWDGSGYPNGLKGERIPMEARIIAVADAYDAMTGVRAYEKALSHEQAIVELMRCSGTHFDPKVVDVFVNEVLPEGHDFGREGTPFSQPYGERRRI